MSAVGIPIGTTVSAGAQQKGPFAWLKPTAAPMGWNRVATPSGTALLSYPPSFRPVHSDPGAVSFVVGTGPRYLAYLNLTPRQGDEKLAGFPAFRVNLIGGDDDTQVHEQAAAEGLHFGETRASVVADDYLTRVGVSHYREIVMLVVGKHGDWVMVAAAMSAHFTEFRPLLRRAMTSLLVS